MKTIKCINFELTKARPIKNVKLNLFLEIAKSRDLPDMNVGSNYPTSLKDFPKRL